MEYLAGPPSFWQVTLTSGALIELWAHAFSVENGEYVFGVLVQATPEEQQDVRVISRPLVDSGRVEITVAKIPESEVAHVEGGWSLREM